MSMDELPQWPRGTVAILVTAGDRPHAIPVSAVVRAGPRRLLLGLARRRESLARLRADPAVTVAVLAEGCAFSADGRATVLDEAATANVTAVAVEVDELHDHLRPTFTIQAGTAWHWTDPDAQASDENVHAALVRLADV
jgi:flavin reductase (DIM6/NTAB) family NADH-FMN oxidoreductase RutF